MNVVEALILFILFIVLPYAGLWKLFEKAKMPGWLGIWCVFLTSFFMSLMFPTIFALGLKGLGPNTKLGGSLLVMAIVGGAVLTPLMGFISEQTHSLALAYCVPLLAYCIIALYSFWGSQYRGSAVVPS